MAFKPRTITLRNVIRSLNDPNVEVVGIYGMGGIGKTTLAKEVGSQSETSKLFDLVIFVEVTVKPDKMRIQRTIAERLGLTLSSEDTEEIRAGKLYHLLKNEKENEKKILIIFDNIWDRLDLLAIGIPLRDECQVCKVLLTSRSIDALEQMGSQRNFPVELLDYEEAWQLFKKMSDDYIEGSEFESVARQLANKCAGLPIAIVTVARALRHKQLFEWEDALQQMKKQSSENMQFIRKSIELSYDYLSPVLKKTIMLIGYANLTSIDELLMFGMRLDLYQGYYKLEERHNRVQALVQQLKDSCLLLDGNTTNKDFSVHDVVRDAVISIASREGHVFELFGREDALQQMKGHSLENMLIPNVVFEKMLVIIYFVLELLTAVFDQLSSVQKPQFAMGSMSFSFVVVILNIVELVYRCRKEKITWKWRSTLPWLYYPSRNHSEPFGKFSPMSKAILEIDDKEGINGEVLFDACGSNLFYSFLFEIAGESRNHTGKLIALIRCYHITNA